VFEALGGGAGGLILMSSDGSLSKQPKRTLPGNTVITADEGDLAAHEQLIEVDPAVRAAAREIAARLWIRRPRPGSTTRRGSGVLSSVPYRAGLDDIDLDRTLEVMAERPVLEDGDIIVRDRIQTRRSVVLAVDVSGSMRDERLRTAAAAVGALAAGVPAADLAVVTFWSDAAWLSHFGDVTASLRLLDMLVAYPRRA
jgi:hypothetical protein